MDHYGILKTDAGKQRRRAMNRQRKLKIERLRVMIAAGQIKESVDFAERIGITPKEYGKIVASVSNF